MRAFFAVFSLVAVSLLSCSGDDPADVAGGGNGGVASGGSGGGSSGFGGTTATTCSKTSDCAGGQFCSLNQTCVPDGSCGASGDCTSPQVCGAGSKKCLDPGSCGQDGDCPSGQVCNAQKKCEIGGGCGKSEFKLTQVAPNVMILLDRSGSMDGAAGSDTRWNVAKKAIAQVTTKFDAKLRFGLATYSSCKSGGCSAGSIVVPIADTNAAAINGFLGKTIDQGSSNGAGTSGGKIQYLCDSGNPETSTGKSLAALVGEPTLQDKTRTNAIILLTDGGESGECVGSCNGPCGSGKLLAQASSVKTYVIGLGVNPSAIDAIAAAGGTTKSVPATNQTELDAAFDKIADAVATCEYVLDSAPADPNKIYVYFNDDPTGVPKDATNGWSYDPVTKKLTFNGSSCAKLKGGTVTDVDVVYGCAGPIVE